MSYTLLKYYDSSSSPQSELEIEGEHDFAGEIDTENVNAVSEVRQNSIDVETKYSTVVSS